MTTLIAINVESLGDGVSIQAYAPIKQSRALEFGDKKALIGFISEHPAFLQNALDFVEATDRLFSGPITLDESFFIGAQVVAFIKDRQHLI